MGTRLYICAHMVPGLWCPVDTLRIHMCTYRYPGGHVRCPAGHCLYMRLLNTYGYPPGTRGYRGRTNHARQRPRLALCLAAQRMSQITGRLARALARLRGCLARDLASSVLRQQRARDNPGPGQPARTSRTSQALRPSLSKTLNASFILRFSASCSSSPTCSAMTGSG